MPMLIADGGAAGAAAFPASRQLAQNFQWLPGSSVVAAGDCHVTSPATLVLYFWRQPTVEKTP